MKQLLRPITGAVVCVLADARVARAGMPMMSLSDIARLRLEAISFFLVCFLVSSGLVWKIWNSARNDFPRLPYLTYWRATGLVALWGLMFLLVLTMISGARELMTPGAWHKQDLTYKVVEGDDAAKAAAGELDWRRRHALDRLRTALWTFARHHDGKFPATSSPPEIPDEAWVVPDPAGMRFLYTSSLVADKGKTPLAYEPGIFGKDRFVLFTNGEIVRMPEDELQAVLVPPAERAP